jgi:hypothetical protein
MSFTKISDWEELQKMQPFDRNGIYLHSKKPQLDQLFHCQSLRELEEKVGEFLVQKRKEN